MYWMSPLRWIGWSWIHEYSCSCSCVCVYTVVRVYGWCSNSARYTSVLWFHVCVHAMYIRASILEVHSGTTSTRVPLLRGWLILRVKIGSIAKSRNSDTFRRSRTKSSFPIAIVSKLLQYGCCNFVGVLNTAHWPICALNISQKYFLWFLGRWPWAPVDSSRFPYGARKNETVQYSVSTIIWVLGVVGAANYTP